MTYKTCRLLSAGAILFCVLSPDLGGQQSASSPGPEPAAWTAAQDHENMMMQLGITKLRPGPSGNESAPNHANYDEATANPFPDLPSVLMLKTGKRVTTSAMWWKQERILARVV